MDKAIVDRTLLELRLRTVELMVTKAILFQRMAVGKSRSQALAEHLAELEGIAKDLERVALQGSEYQHLAEPERAYFSDEFREFFESLKARIKQTFDLP
ncbi:MAG: hypothetical protein ACRD3Q_15860 [Terriglobales bacterium]